MFYLALILLLASLAAAQQSMLCPKHSPGKVLILPRTLSCDVKSTLGSIQNEPTELTYQLYKHNIVKYKSDGWLCKAVTRFNVFLWRRGLEADL